MRRQIHRLVRSYCWCRCPPTPQSEMVWSQELLVLEGHRSAWHVRVLALGTPLILSHNIYLYTTSSERNKKSIKKINTPQAQMTRLASESFGPVFVAAALPVAYFVTKIYIT